MAKRSEKETPCFATTSMGERGQVVIPKEIRELLGLKVGDRFIVLATHKHGLGLIPMDQAHQFMAKLKQQMEDIIN
ncbi:MAG: AbrB/MazE/SpoVT family DNA-binding domain-containing protein [Patescibacteria group bacterium]|nr:AbrB/MazE/SpoVT family DNA-binding domain-containing protein [Patescibacteria group bacterium]